ncbi:MAG: hypothetical protein R2880_01290 [Deinococcales bacterium]
MKYQWKYLWFSLASLGLVANYVLANANQRNLNTIILFYSLALWLLIGWGFGLLIRGFVNRIAIWLGMGLLVLLLLIGLGVVYVNTYNLNQFFENIREWLIRSVRYIGNQAAVRIDGLTLIAFLLGLALSTRKRAGGS